MKRSIRLFMASCSLITVGSIITPMLASCTTDNTSDNNNSNNSATNTDTNNNNSNNNNSSNNNNATINGEINSSANSKYLTYDTQNKQLVINDSKLVFTDQDDNIFNAYNDCLICNEILWEKNLRSIYSTWLDSLKVSYDDISFDVRQAKIDGFSLIIPTNLSISKSSKQSTELTSTKIVYKQLTVSQLNDDLKNKTYISTSVLPVYKLEDAKNLPARTILQSVGLSNNGTIIFDGGSSFPLSTYSIYKDSNAEQVLRVLVFVPTKGLSQIFIKKSNLQTIPVKPSKEITSVFGEEAKNNWNDIANQNMTSIDEQVMTNISYSNNTITSNTEVQKSALVTEQLTKYTEEASFQNNVQSDLNFFLKNYLQDIETTWNISGLLKHSVFTTSNLTADSQNKTVSGSFGIVIDNLDTVAKLVTLPITNEQISVNPNSTITIIIKFENSQISPYLNINTTVNNTAYLTTAFNNVELQVSQTLVSDSLVRRANVTKQSFTLNSHSISSNLNRSTATQLSNATFTDPINVFPYSYAMKIVINNVGFGNSLENSQTIIDESLQQLTADDLKDVLSNNIQNTQRDVFESVRIIQSLLTKAVANPTLHDFLHSIVKEAYDISFLVTNDSNLSTIISDVLSNKKASEFLYDNLQNIMSILKNLSKQYPQLSKIVDILQQLANSNLTLAQLQDSIASINNLYPYLEQILDANVRWLTPFLGQVLTSISENDPPIVTLLFDNIDGIFQLLTNHDNTQNLDSSVVKVANTIHSYLKSLLSFSNGQTSTNDYKTIRVLDVLAYELSSTTRESTLLNSIVTILEIAQPNLSIIDTLKNINTMIGSSIIVPTKIKDYSTATFDNEVSKSGWISPTYSVKNYRVQSSTIVTSSLQTQLAKIINSFLNVQVGSQTVDLYTMLTTNVQTTIQQKEFTLNSDVDQKTITQDLTVKMNFKETVTLDLLPLSVLLDNVTLNIQDMIQPVSEQLRSSSQQRVGNQLITVTPGTSTATNINTGGMTIDKLVVQLGAMLPIDLVIKPENYLQLSYRANSAKLTPVIDSTGKINWAYKTDESIAVSYDDKTNGVLQSSNTKYPTSKTQDVQKTKSYYGSKYNANGVASFYGGYLGVDVTMKIVIIPVSGTIGLFPNIINFNGGLTNSFNVNTNLVNAKQITNYNPNIFVDGATVTQATADFQTYLATLINNYGQWTVGSSSNKPEFSLKSGNDLDAKIKEYFSFGSAFSTNKYVSYKYGISASQYKLSNDNYTYTFTLNFNTPILYKVNSDDPGTLLSKMEFTVISNNAPTPVTEEQSSLLRFINLFGLSM